MCVRSFDRLHFEWRIATLCGALWFQTCFPILLNISTDTLEISQNSHQLHLHCGFAYSLCVLLLRCIRLRQTQTSTPIRGIRPQFISVHVANDVPYTPQCPVYFFLNKNTTCNENDRVCG